MTLSSDAIVRDVKALRLCDGDSISVQESHNEWMRHLQCSKLPEVKASALIREAARSSCWVAPSEWPGGIWVHIRTPSGLLARLTMALFGVGEVVVDSVAVDSSSPE